MAAVTTSVHINIISLVLFFFWWGGVGGVVILHVSQDCSHYLFSVIFFVVIYFNFLHLFVNKSFNFSKAQSPSLYFYSPAT